MSINLEAQPYEGGALMIRERESERVIEQIENTGAGDAVLFRIDPAFQHRATAVTRGVKTAFAGWFRSEEPLRACLARGAA
jgi:predicted 2-oxoglutarate/Fe(II)-dependent dioxygenase YbiX